MRYIIKDNNPNYKGTYFKYWVFDTEDNSYIMGYVDRDEVEELINKWNN